MGDIKYYNEEDKDVIAKVIEIAEENGFSVDVYNNREDKEEYYFEFGKFSDCGRDFTFSIFFNTLDDISDIADKIYEYYDDFDDDTDDDVGFSVSTIPSLTYAMYLDRKDDKKIFVGKVDELDAIKQSVMKIINTEPKSEQRAIGDR